MLRSKAVAKVNPFLPLAGPCLFLGLERVFLLTSYLLPKKLLKKHTVLSFLGIMKDGKAHSDTGCLSNTPQLHNLSTSLMMVSLWIFGTGKAQPW
jgi:hypothetical protein